VVETPSSYFEEQWGRSTDPWDHAGRWYETRKYDLTVAALPHARYRHAVEPACGVGLVTARLARRAERVSATDRFPGAVGAATARCADLDNVVVTHADVRDGPPPEPYDLAVLGEVLYYFDAATVDDVIRRWHARCAPGGHVVLVHHRPPVPEHVLGGDEVHDIAREVLGAPAVTLVDASFRLDVFTSPST
jgi:SAM-dependent methyltransferase